MNWKKKKVLVTGAGGFIGSHLVERLVKLGATVRALVKYNSRNDWGMIEYLPVQTRKKMEIIQGDIRDAKFCREAAKNCDIVFHLAALIAIPYSYHAPESYVDTNIKGTLNIINACLENKVRKVVHTSTSEVYGTAKYVPIDENHPLQGQSPYSATKIGADKIAESYYLSFGLPVATIRPFNTFGPRQSARAIIPTIITQALCSGRIKLGSLKPIRDLTYVKDTVEGFIRIAESDKTAGEVINIGTGKGVSVGELVGLIGKIIGRKIEVICDRKRLRPPKSEVLRLICNNKKAEKLLSWKPSFSLENGIIETKNWIEKHLDFYKSDIYNI